MTYLLPAHTSARSTTTYYTGVDSDILHDINRKRFGPTWRFYDSTITYRYNSLGYRMNKELHEIDYNNYIAFFGCSFTFGTGLPLQETYAHRVATALNLGDNYINASIEASSPSFLALNLTQFFKQVTKLPRAIIINWPPIHRIHYWFRGNPLVLSPNMNQPPVVRNYWRKITTPDLDHWQKAYEAAIVEDSYIFNTFKHIKDTATTLAKLAGTPLIQFSTAPTISFDPTSATTFHQHHPDIEVISSGREHYSQQELTTPQPHNLVSGRDIAEYGGQYFAHPGTAHQENVTKYILERI